MPDLEYPPDYPPDHPHPFVRASWSIVDLLPGLTGDKRFLLAGTIAGALMRVYQAGRDGLPPPDLTE